MKKGDIVRVVKCGIPVGRWYMVDKLVGKKYIYVKNNISIKPFRLQANTVIKVYTKSSVCISKSDYKKLSKHYTNTYYHKVSPAYDKIYDEQPEIIEFWCIGKKNRIYLRTDGIYRRRIEGEICIRMYFSERIFRPLFE